MQTVPVRGAKQRALLALLALQRGQPVSADRLIDALWGDGQSANPANALQAQIGQLRRTLGATRDRHHRGRLCPRQSARMTSTQSASNSWWPRAGGCSRRGTTVLASAALGEALRLRRGEPLAEFAYADFADTENEHISRS